MELNVVENELIELVAKTVNRPAHEIRVEVSFPDLGMDSLAAMFLLDDLEQKLKIEINPLLFWEYPTIRTFAEALLRQIESTPSRS
jgi:acyl carrier protein